MHLESGAGPLSIHLFLPLTELWQGFELFFTSDLMVSDLFILRQKLAIAKHFGFYSDIFKTCSLSGNRWNQLTKLH